MFAPGALGPLGDRRWAERRAVGAAEHAEGVSAVETVTDQVVTQDGRNRDAAAAGGSLGLNEALLLVP